jgi:quercetin dioxygenase-like cupin family protein
MKTQENIKLIRSAATGTVSVIEFNIIPEERTPWPYHTLFSEAFEILNGTLEVGLNDHVKQLNQGDQVTIKPNEKHYFNNILIKIVWFG